MKPPEPSSVTQSPDALTLLYDGHDERLQHEVSALRDLDPNRRLRFVDVSLPGFDLLPYRRALADLQSQIHGLRPNGSMVFGDNAVRLAYAAVGKSWKLPWRKWLIVGPLFQSVRWVFTQHLHLVSRHPLAWLTKASPVTERHLLAYETRRAPCRLELVPEVDASLALVSGVPVLSDAVEADLPC